MRRSAWRVGLVVVLSVATVRSGIAQIPDTPIGRQFTAWLTAFNTRDREVVHRFIETARLAGSFDSMLEQFTATGGYDARRLVQASETRLVVLARERGDARAYVRITMTVAPTASSRIIGLVVTQTEPPADLAPAKLTEGEAAAARNERPFRQFSAWLDAFNSGDWERLSQMQPINRASFGLDAMVRVRQSSGGFELRRLEQASATSLTGLMQECGSDQFVRFIVSVEAREPYRITRLTMSAIPRPAEFAIARGSASTVAEALRAKLERDAAADRFSGAALLARITHEGTAVLFSGAYGWADREQRIPNTLETRFRIASMNKVFTDVEILQLVEAGKLRLADPVGKYLMDYPNRDVASKVTIYHLLMHTGGTGEIPGSELAARRWELRTHADYVAFYGHRPLVFEPGSRTAYSNYGMLLLGAVIERVSGESYYDYVAEHVFQPAGMTRTGSEPESTPVAERAVGYLWHPAGKWTPNTNALPYRGTAAGGGYSTVGDLLKFADAVLSHRLLRPESTALLIAGVADDDAGAYSAGVSDGREIAGAEVVGHTGGGAGVSADLRIYIKSGYVVVVLSNLDPPSGRVAPFLDVRLPR
jgi:CubicO group peptidase (beta-lactamase class C family)